MMIVTDRVTLKKTILLSSSGLVLCAMALSASAFAQDAAKPADAAAAAVAEETIVITGSRIARPEIQGASPVTVISPQEIKFQGATRAEDLVNNLPQAFAGQGGNLSNGSTGTATVDLRGLGPARTLVLINGRRLIPGDPRNPVADINTIPASLIKRVDILTGGASSVYGADAVAGVVNFIMDTDFEGISFDSQYSFYHHNNHNSDLVGPALEARNYGYPKGSVTDGGVIDASLKIGTAFAEGKGHITAYTNYRKANPILQDSRDFSSCALTANTPAQIKSRAGRILQCGGSATSANGTFFVYDDGTSATVQVGSGRNFIPGNSTFNFAPYNYYQRPDERYSFGVFANYEINDYAKPYFEAMFMDDRTVAQIAPSGNFGATTTLNCDNPLLSAQQKSIICDAENLVDVDGNAAAAGGGAAQVFTGIDATTGLPYTYNKGFAQILRRNVEGGGRRDDLQHTSYRIVTGTKGEIGKGMNYDLYYQYGRVNFAQTYRNDFSIARITKALDVVTGPTGAPICRSVQDGTDPNCVPWDIFAPGGVSAGSLAYLQTPGLSRGQTTEQIASGSITIDGGEYGMSSPMASSGVGINVGAEYRREGLNFETDTAFSTGDLAGQGGATIGLSGNFSVKELFTEVVVPLVEDRPFFHSLSVGGGFRYSKYNVGGASKFSTNTYKIEGDWSPVRDVRFRATYNRAVRAPNLVELFSAQSVSLDGNSDPCAKVIAATDLGCLAQGLRVGQNVRANPAGQYNGFQGGNPGLKPEKATSKTLGIVFTPSFLPGFSATIDGFDIKVKQNIGVIGADTILQQCVNTVDPFFCGLIHRDQFGSLWLTNDGYVNDTNLNTGAASTRGIDFAVSYTREIGNNGSLGFSLIGTYLDTLITDTGVFKLRDDTGAVSTTKVPVAYDCKGFYGLQCGTPNPKWRHKARVTWTSASGINVSAAWRYFASVKLDKTSADFDLRQANQATLQPQSLKIGSQSYFDLATAIHFAEKYSFNLGVNNILDKSPPVVGSNALTGVTGNGNTFPQVYDALGRYIYAGVTLDF
jgi:iron complex outermembrane recepter protein